MSPPPPPFHILRTHSAPLSALAFNPGNTLLYSADQDGYVGITDLAVRRTVAYWRAHAEGVLGVEEWEGGLISHGRDNLIHIHAPLPPHRRLSPNTGPPILHTLPVNALNFCRFALLPLPSSTSIPFAAAAVDADDQSPTPTPQALLAVPNMLDSELVDIYHLPSLKRLHAGLNAPSTSKGKGKAPEGGESNRSGLVMSLHLRFMPEVLRQQGWEEVGLVMGYEDGRVEVWGVPVIDGGGEGKKRWAMFSDGSGKVGARVWQKVWVSKVHNEAVMAMAVDADCGAAYTVSADHQLVKYDLLSAFKSLDCPPESATPTPPTSPVPHTLTASTRAIGHATLALSPGGILGVGGWDGRVRLFSARSLKPLGTLKYHREGVQALAFAFPRGSSGDARHRAAGGDGASTIDLDVVHGDVSEVGSSDAAGTAESDADGSSGSGSDTEREEGRGWVGVGLSGKGQRRAGDAPRERWLASGGKDRRVALWGLMDFAAGA